MTKREALVMILSKLVPYWDMAEWFLLIAKEEWNDGLIDLIYGDILKNIRNINSINQRTEMKNVLELIKEKSAISMRKDEQEADNILNDFINNL